MTKQEAAKAFHEADAAWEALLPKVTNARYLLIGMGATGTALNEAYKARDAARVRWEQLAFEAPKPKANLNRIFPVDAIYTIVA